MAESGAWPKEAIIVVLIASIAATTYLLLIGFKHLFGLMQKALATDNRDGMWANMVTSMGQVVAALSNLVDQSLLLDEVLNPPANAGNGCFPVVSDIAYMLFQLCATLVLIRRATSVIPKRSSNWLYRRDFVQVGFSLVFFVGYALIVISISMRHVAASNGQSCKIPQAISLNSTGKIVLVALYISLAICFSFPLIKHMRNMASMASTSEHSSSSGAATTSTSAGGTLSSSPPSHQEKTTPVASQNIRRPHTTTAATGGNGMDANAMLRELLRNVTLKIMIAVIVNLITAIWKMLGGFAGAFQVAFALQNISALYAVTLAGKSKKKHRDAASSSAAPSTATSNKLVNSSTASQVKSVPLEMGKQ
ncbi:hypothetical protein BCR44DRAFT_76703 [Catenaria anguillulae PL171]|uniref:Uncharacterized protein n=1 Tax=Catenaria anguillulae PL171 TaxID=765915 RepID=A0A1Y2I2G0_9FUNG|nr:hypothetical protein BCR44DRAFT_76703 [Catenaria anguillulae PL171]